MFGPSSPPHRTHGGLPVPGPPSHRGKLLLMPTRSTPTPTRRHGTGGRRSGPPGRWRRAALVAPAAGLGGLLALTGVAAARPVAPAAFCAQYPQAPACGGGVVECALCHTTPPARNSYGAQVAEALAPDAPRPLDDAAFLAGLAAALTAVEGRDADGDGASNLVEIEAGTSPADARQVPITAGCTSPPGSAYDTCAYDARYVFKKVHLDFCGHSPRAEDLAAFEAARQGAAGDAAAAVHAALDRCLESEFWRGREGVVWSLAHDKIRPLASIKAGADAGDVPLADYEDDYNFFVHAHTGDQDVRDVLVGQHLVFRTDPPRGPDGQPAGRTEYQAENRGVAEDVNTRTPRVAQLVAPDRRAGLMTHRWFLTANTMFTAIPRTTAAQAYRAFLGLDIARLEGLYPVAQEPVDHDNRGVQVPTCAQCHSTLDPLTYPFTRYNGIGGGQGTPFSYNENRLRGFRGEEGPQIVDTPEAGSLFGQPVADLIAWARVAADSDQFARATVLDYWKLLMGEPPRGDEQAEFESLWRNLMVTHDYRIRGMLHDLVETEAYGVP